MSMSTREAHGKYDAMAAMFNFRVSVLSGVIDTVIQIGRLGVLRYVTHGTMETHERVSGSIFSRLKSAQL